MLALLFSISTTAHVISPIQRIDSSLFTQIEPKEIPSPSPVPEVIVETRPFATPSTRPQITIPESRPRIVVIQPPTPRVVSAGKFILDPEVSWYGPGFYGKRTACGKAYTKQIMGVANKTLPCGTLVTFKYKNRIATVPVIDRGPYVAGRQWDLSGGLCTYLGHCFTGPIYYAVGSH